MFYVKEVINAYFTTLSDMRYSLLLKINDGRCDSDFDIACIGRRSDCLYRKSEKVRCKMHRLPGGKLWRHRWMQWKL